MKHILEFNLNENISDSREWNVSFTRHSGLMGSKHRDLTDTEKWRMLNVSGPEAFAYAYIKTINEIGKHFKIGNFIGIRNFWNYEDIELYYETALVKLEIYDFNSFPNNHIVDVSGRGKMEERKSYNIYVKEYIPDYCIRIKQK